MPAIPPQTMVKSKFVVTDMITHTHTHIYISYINMSFVLQMPEVKSLNTTAKNFSRKVAVSIPDGVIEIFHWRIPSGRNTCIALLSTQTLTEMSIRNISWGEGGGMLPVRGPYNLTIFLCLLSWNLRDSTSWNPQGLSKYLFFKGRAIGPVYSTAASVAFCTLGPEGVPSFISRSASDHTGTRDLY
jgi:hypothetical protein